MWFVKKPSFCRHIISFLTGLLSLHFLFSTSIYYIIFFVVLGYVLLFITTHFQCKKYRTIILILSSFLYLVLCELWIVDAKQWHRIRGPQMIIVMKSISLAFDLDVGKVKTVPNFVYYAGILRYFKVLFRIYICIFFLISREYCCRVYIITQLLCFWTLDII